MARQESAQAKTLASSSDPRQQEKQARTYLEQSLFMLEGYLQDLWRFLPIPICYVNPVNNVLDTNTAFRELSGYNNQEVVGEKIGFLFGDREGTEEIKQNIKEQERTEQEFVLITKEGDEIPIHIYSQQRKDKAGELLGYFLALIDITTEKKFQQELEEEVERQTKELQDTQKALMNMLEDTEEARRRTEEERKKTESIITNFTDGLLAFNEYLYLTMINPRAEELFEVRGDDILGTHISKLAEHSSHFKAVVEKFEQEGTEMTSAEIQVEPSPRTLEVKAITLSSKRSGVGFMLVFHDITRERQIEKLKTEFVSLAAHQLRTPLSAIKWTLTMLLEGDAGELASQQRELLDKTYQSNERMITLINDLLDVTRIEEGRYLYKSKFIHIEEVMQLMVESFQERAERQGLTLRLKLPQDRLPQVLADEEKIQLVFQNLLENSFRYTPEEGKITVSATNEGERIVVAVQDTGVGIPETEQRRVFQKFFRASNVKRIDTEGSGLGLYLIKNIIEAHEGEIWFKSKEGEGTTMYFSLPVKQEMEEFLKKF